MRLPRTCALHDCHRVQHFPYLYKYRFNVLLLGQLYLGVFSGPVEGILMIVAIYTITAIYGKHYS